MGGTWRSEDLASEAIFQLDRLAVDDHLLGPGRRPVAGTAISHILGKSERKIVYNIHQETSHSLFRLGALPADDT